MTDEELAKIRSTEFTDERGIGYVAYYAGFLAGLKEGRPKWHKVDDGDLPPFNTTVLNEDCDKVTYCGEGEWQAYSEYYEEYVVIETPIAWCEIPKFEEAK